VYFFHAGIQSKARFFFLRCLVVEQFNRDELYRGGIRKSAILSRGTQFLNFRFISSWGLSAHRWSSSPRRLGTGLCGFPKICASAKANQHRGGQRIKRHTARSINRLVLLASYNYFGIDGPASGHFFFGARPSINHILQPAALLHRRSFAQPGNFSSSSCPSNPSGSYRFRLFVSSSHTPTYWLG